MGLEKMDQIYKVNEESLAEAAREQCESQKKVNRRAIRLHGDNSYLDYGQGEQVRLDNMTRSDKVKSWLLLRFGPCLLRCREKYVSIKGTLLETVPKPKTADDEEEFRMDTVPFHLSMACVLTIHSAIIVLELDAEDGEEKEMYGIANLIMLMCYFLEVIFRLLARGLTGISVANVVDGCFILAAFMEKIVGVTNYLMSLPILRLIGTLLTLGQIQKYLHDMHILQMVIHSVLRLRATVLWAMAMLTMVLWSFAALGMVVVGESGEWADSTDPGQIHEPFESFDRDAHFGSMPRSWLTMLQFATVSRWAVPARAIAKVYPLTLLFFLFFILITAYGLIASIVAEILTEVLWSARSIKAAEEELRQEKRKAVSSKIMEVIAAADENNDGLLSAVELDQVLTEDFYKDFKANPKGIDVRKTLLELGLPFSVLNGADLIKVMDTSGDGLVSYTEFRDTMVSLDDDVTPNDYIRLTLRTHSTALKSGRIQRKMTESKREIIVIRELLAAAFYEIEDFFLSGKRADVELEKKTLAYIRSAPPALPPTVQSQSKDWAREQRAIRETEEMDKSARVKFMQMIKTLLPPTEHKEPSKRTTPATAEEARTARLAKRRSKSAPNSPPKPPPQVEPPKPPTTLPTSAEPAPPAIPPTPSSPSMPRPPVALPPGIPSTNEDSEEEDWHVAASAARKHLLTYDHFTEATAVQAQGCKHEAENKSQLGKAYPHPLAPTSAYLNNVREEIGNDLTEEDNIAREQSRRLKFGTAPPTMTDSRKFKRQRAVAISRKCIIDWNAPT